MDATPPATEVICASIGEGARDSGCKYGPQALIDAGLLALLRRHRGLVRLGATVASRPEAASSRMDTVADFSNTLALEVRESVLSGRRPLVLGGDHSCAIGTWSGVAEAARLQGAPSLGLVWIDAHLDAHTSETSPSQAPHGMPLASLLGRGDARLSGIFGWRGKLAPSRVVVVGARSYEPEEQALLRSLGVRVMLMREVQRRGLEECLEEAIELVQAGGAWGLTLDVDAIDPLDFSATGTPEPDGLALPELEAALQGLAERPGFQALEICEYNPLRDYGGQGARALGRLASRAWAGLDAVSPLRP